MEWISIKSDIKPQGVEDVLGLLTGGIQRVVYLHPDGGWFYSVAIRPAKGVTHWMPLPESPRKGSDMKANLYLVTMVDFRIDTHNYAYVVASNTDEAVRAVIAEDRTLEKVELLAERIGQGFCPALVFADKRLNEVLKGD